LAIRAEGRKKNGCLVAGPSYRERKKKNISKDKCVVRNFLRCGIAALPLGCGSTTTLSGERRETAAVASASASSFAIRSSYG
jgi:hypothetical protein